MHPQFTSLYTHSNRPSPTLSPTHNTIVTVSSPKSIHIRSTRSLATLSILSSSSTRKISYAPNGKTLFVLLSNPIAVDVYDITSENNPKKIRRIHLAPPRPYTSFVFSPDSSGFVTFSEFSLYVLCVCVSLSSFYCITRQQRQTCNILGSHNISNGITSCSDKTQVSSVFEFQSCETESFCCDLTRTMQRSIEYLCCSFFDVRALFPSL